MIDLIFGVKKDVVTVVEDATVGHAVRIMDKTKIGSLIVVVEKGGKVSGFLTGRDVILNVVAKGKDPENTLVRDIMVKNPVTLPYDEHLTVVEVVDCMARAKVRRLPLVDTEGKPVGIVCFDDVIVFIGELLERLGSVIAPVISAAKMTSRIVNSKS